MMITPVIILLQKKQPTILLGQKAGHNSMKPRVICIGMQRRYPQNRKRLIHSMDGNTDLILYQEKYRING